MALIAIVTNAGRAALVNAANTGTAPVTISAVGITAQSVAPSATATMLPGEIKRIATLSGDVVADDTIHLVVRDEGPDIFTLRSFALYLDDGTLFAIYGQADIILEKSAQAMMLLAIDIRFEDVDATAIAFGDTNFLNPPATAERVGVVELATPAEATAGADDLRAVTPKGLKSAVTSWLDGRFGAGAPSDFMKGLLGAASAAAARLALGLKSAALKDEGAGKGLDADLLDGQHGAYYADILARLGYTPLNATAYTAADIRNKLLTVDGAGSGIDADLLDGQHGSYYTAIAARLGYTPLNATAYTAADVRAKLLTVDGAGSGIDADTVDGQHASAFAKVADFASLQANNGYVKLPGGLILQWVNVGGQAGASTPFAWPIQFPKAVFAAVATARQGLNFSGSLSVYLTGVTNAGGNLWANNGGSVATSNCIIAIGN